MCTQDWENLDALSRMAKWIVILMFLLLITDTLTWSASKCRTWPLTWFSLSRDCRISAGEHFSTDGWRRWFHILLVLKHSTTQLACAKTRCMWKNTACFTFENGLQRKYNAINSPQNIPYPLTLNTLSVSFLSFRKQSRKCFMSMMDSKHLSWPFGLWGAAEGWCQMQ